METFDARALLPNYEAASAIKKKLQEQGYFRWIIARWGSLEATKYFEPEGVDPSDRPWYQFGWKNGRVEFKLDMPRRGRRRYDYNALNLYIETDFYGLSSEKYKTRERARPGVYIGSYQHHIKKTAFDATKMPISWPGITLLAASLNPVLRKTLNELCAEGYQKFVQAFPGIAPYEHHELHSDIEDYEESSAAQVNSRRYRGHKIWLGQLGSGLGWYEIPDLETGKKVCGSSQEALKAAEEFVNGREGTGSVTRLVERDLKAMTGGVLARSVLEEAREERERLKKLETRAFEHHELYCDPAELGIDV